MHAACRTVMLPFAVSRVPFLDPKLREGRSAPCCQGQRINVHTLLPYFGPGVHTLAEVFTH